MYQCTLTDIELTETMIADVRVYFRCTHNGFRATHTSPAEGPEFEVQEVDVLSLSGQGGEKTGDEAWLAGWGEIAHKAAEKAVGNYGELYEHQMDAYWNYDPEPYWD